MADCSDVESVLACVIAQIAYPDGSAAASATGDKCKVYRGWPIPAALDADLQAGVVNISVFPLDPERNVTRYTEEWQELPCPPVTLTLTVADRTITVGGTPCCPVNAAILVNHTPAVYPLQATDTATTVATALAALLNTFTGASSAGPVITVPGTAPIQARVGTVGSLVREIKRQKKSFRVTVWCNDPLVRDAWGRTIDQGLAALSFLALSDGTSGRLRYERSHTDDASQKSRLYRRDLVYSVEYATTQVQTSAQIVAETVTIAGGLDPNATPVKTISF